MADLVTAEEYKEDSGISSTKDDTRLDALVTSVSTLVKTYCGRAFVDYVSVDKVETVSIGSNEYFIQLGEFPFISLTSFKERASYSDDYVSLTEAAQEIFVDIATDSIYKTNGGTGYANFYQGPGAVEITYKAGYAAVPEDLKLVVYDLITYYLKNEYRGYQQLKGASSQTPASSSQYRNVAFPDHIKRVLDLYKDFG